jgi:hypothetical protein
MKLTRFHVVKILEWCENEYGYSKYNKGVLTIEFQKPTYLTEGLLGEYDAIENMIYVNSRDHENLDDLCKTVIEEYGHYLKNDREYQRLYDEYDYDNHPHEIECRERAERDYKRCLEELSGYHKQFQIQ